MGLDEFQSKVLSHFHPLIQAGKKVDVQTEWDRLSSQPETTKLMSTLQEYGNRLFWDGVVASKLDRYLAKNLDPDEAFLQLQIDEGKEMIFSLEKPTQFNYKNLFTIEALLSGDIQVRVWPPKTVDHPESILSLLVFDKRWRGKVTRRGNLFMDREMLCWHIMLEDGSLLQNESREIFSIARTEWESEMGCASYDAIGERFMVSMGCKRALTDLQILEISALRQNNRVHMGNFMSMLDPKVLKKEVVKGNLRTYPIPLSGKITFHFLDRSNPEELYALLGGANQRTWNLSKTIIDEYREPRTFVAIYFKDTEWGLLGHTAICP